MTAAEIERMSEVAWALETGWVELFSVEFSVEPALDARLADAAVLVGACELTARRGVTASAVTRWIERRQIPPPRRARAPDPAPAVRVGDAPLPGR